jgi:hypothetical protein
MTRSAAYDGPSIFGRSAKESFEQTYPVWIGCGTSRVHHTRGRAAARPGRLSCPGRLTCADGGRCCAAQLARQITHLRGRCDCASQLPLQITHVRGRRDRTSSAAGSDRPPARTLRLHVLSCRFRSPTCADAATARPQLPVQIAQLRGRCDCTSSATGARDADADTRKPGRAAAWAARSERPAHHSGARTRCRFVVRLYVVVLRLCGLRICLAVALGIRLCLCWLRIGLCR